MMVPRLVMMQFPVQRLRERLQIQMRTSTTLGNVICIFAVKLTPFIFWFKSILD